MATAASGDVTASSSGTESTRAMRRSEKDDLAATSSDANPTFGEAILSASGPIPAASNRSSCNDSDGMPDHSCCWRSQVAGWGCHNTPRSSAGSDCDWEKAGETRARFPSQGGVRPQQRAPDGDGDDAGGGANGFPNNRLAPCKLGGSPCGCSVSTVVGGNVDQSTSIIDEEVVDDDGIDHKDSDEGVCAGDAGENARPRRVRVVGFTGQKMLSSGAEGGKSALCTSATKQLCSTLSRRRSRMRRHDCAFCVASSSSLMA